MVTSFVSNFTVFFLIRIITLTESLADREKQKDGSIESMVNFDVDFVLLIGDKKSFQRQRSSSLFAGGNFERNLYL